MSEQEANKIDLIKQIPDCEISWDEFSKASFEGGKTAPQLGGVYTDYASQGVDKKFNLWHDDHSWVPVNNRKQFPHFARCIFCRL